MTYVTHNESEDGSEIDMSVEIVMISDTTGSYQPDVALANFEADASDDNSGTKAFDHSDRESNVPMAAYAPPEVYLIPTQGTTMDHTFSSDDDDMSFDYSSPPPSENSDEDSFYTDVGDDLVMLQSPGQSEDRPIDLTNSTEAIDLTHSTDNDDEPKEKTSTDEPLFSDTSDEYDGPHLPKKPNAARELYIPSMEEQLSDEEGQWNLTREEAFNTIYLMYVFLLDRLWIMTNFH